MWVIVIYEDEKFLRKVLKKVDGLCCVRCLTKPFGIRTPQDLEREDDAVFYSDIYKTDVKPVLSQIDENGKKGRKWTWNY